MNLLRVSEAKEIAERIVGFELQAEPTHRYGMDGVRFYVESITGDQYAMEVFFDPDPESQEEYGTLKESRVRKVANGMVDNMKRDGAYDNFV